MPMQSAPAIELPGKEPTGPAIVTRSGMLSNAAVGADNPSGPRRVDAEVPGEIRRDQWKRPLIIRAVQNPVTGLWEVPRDAKGREIVELEGYTRASSLGNAVEDSHGLNVWQRGAVVFGMSRRPDLVALALAVPNFEEKEHRPALYKIAEQAKEAANASGAANTGTALHSLTDQDDAGALDRGLDLGRLQGTMDAYRDRMAGWTIVRSETFVVSDRYHSAGTFDRLVTPNEPVALVDADGNVITVIMPGDVVVVDLKTSSTASYFGCKFLAQLAVYSTGALYDWETGARTPLGARTDIALILHAPQGGEDATWWVIDLRVGQAIATLAAVNLEARKARFLKTALRPVQVRTATAEEVEQSTPSAAIPRGVIDRAPMGSYPSATAPLVAAAQCSPEQADAIDAELVAEEHEPQGRHAAPAALDPAPFTPPAATPAAAAPVPSAGMPAISENLAGKLQAAAADRARRDKLIDRVTFARDRDDLVRLYRWAKERGYWDDELQRLAEGRRDALARRAQVSA